MSKPSNTARVVAQWRPVLVVGLTAACAALFSLTAQAGSFRSCDPAAFERLRDQTLIPLFDALQAGNLNEIQRHLGADRAAEYAVLLKQNPTYGQFLRDYYADSSYEIVDVEGRGREYTATVVIYWADGRTAEVELEFNKPRGDLAAAVAPGRQCGEAP